MLEMTDEQKEMQLEFLSELELSQVIEAATWAASEAVLRAVVLADPEQSADAVPAQIVLNKHLDATRANVERLIAAAASETLEALGLKPPQLN
jgi:hypothetical protein